MSNYVPLHVHTHFSQMDGVATPEEYAFRANALEMPAIAITDHGGLPGHRPMYRAAKEQGIKPILGIEAYFAPDRFDKRDKAARTTPLDLIYNHLVVLAKNPKGLANLNTLNELAWTEGYYKKPRMDFELLDRYGDDLIVTSACMSGLINKAIEEDEYAVAKHHINWFKDRFGEDFYVELMPHNTPGMNMELYALANEMNVASIVTPDCHHCTVDQKVVQEAMLILNTNPKRDKDHTFEQSQAYDNMLDRLDFLYPERKMTFRKFDIHMLSYDEMHDAMDRDGVFGEEIYTNTLDIADKVDDYQIKSNLNLLPVKVDNPDKELRDLVVKGLKELDLFDNADYVLRMNEELDTIKQKEFAPYFLIEHNVINEAKRRDIMVGPGRGSAAGSLVCYALGITQVDPIKHNLLFFRFIDPSRSDFPDIDTDIQDNRRREIKDYLEEQYTHVASIATYVKFNGKGIVRDVARVLSVPLADVNRVLKTVDTWEDYCRAESTKEFRRKYPEIEVIGEGLMGRIRGSGIHPAGIVTASEPIFQHAPLEMRVNPANKEEKIPVVAVDMDEAADIGLIKFDMLGLKTLTVIADTVKSIKDRHKIDIDLVGLPLDDKYVYQMLSDGNTKGVFQCEATPYTNLLIKMQVRTFDELAASNALVRPGAMNTIGKEYLARKRGINLTTYVHPIMKPYLEDTYGCVLYQEQVMLACTTLGGMTMEEANKVRKIIGKKKDVHEFDEFKAKFVEGASRYTSTFIAESLWHDFEAHAGYSFNKSHAVAYSMISYWTAWLKFYYPTEFMFALLKNENDPDVRTEYIIESKRINIPIKLPHVNESDIDFSIEGKGIRIGLEAAKFMSIKSAEKIIKNRPYGSAEEVRAMAAKKGSGVNKRALNSLDMVGALAFPDNPRDPQKVKESLYEYLNLPEFNIKIPQHFYPYISDMEDYDETKAFILMGMAKKIKRGKGWTRIEFMDKTGMVGIFDEQDTKIEKNKTYIILAGSNRIAAAIPIEELELYKDHPLIKYLGYKSLPYGQDEGYVLSFNPRVTKAGQRMAHMLVADYERNLIPVVVFPKQFAQGYMKCEPGTAKKLDLGQIKDGTIILNGVLK